MVFDQTKKSIVSSILIVSTLLMPFSFIPKKVEAQSFGGYTSGLAPAIAKLPQCKKVVNTGINNLFSGIGIGSVFGESGGSEDLGDISPLPLEQMPLNSINTDMSSNINKELDSDSSLDLKAASAKIKAASPAVNDAEGNRLNKLQLEELKKISKSSADLNANSSCIQSIGRLIIKMLLQKLTMSTVNWINSGFNGSPAFIQDPSKFFGDIAKNEVLQFGAEINNPELFPFGKEWLRNTAAAFNNKFQDNARYSLDKMIQDTTPEYSALTFGQDFSQGGWNAWTAMTQSPANNPMGFKLMADNEIQKRLAGTTESTAQYTHEALQAANGFLGDERCVDPEGVTREEDTKGRIERSSLSQNAGGDMQYVYAHNICNKWEYVTPGKMVADAATNVMGYQNNAYLNAEDLNDAVAAVLDALLGKFSQNIFDKGFANIGTAGSDGSLIFAGTGNYDDRTQTEKDFMPSQLSSSWLQANPDFNIRTDLTQALIDEQRTYSDKLALQNKELMSTTDGKEYHTENWIECAKSGQTCSFSGTKVVRIGSNENNYIYKTATDSMTCPPASEQGIWTVEGKIGKLLITKEVNTCSYSNDISSNAYGLMPVIYQLDYCIPGPHPGWESDAKQALTDRLNSITPAEEKPENKAGKIANGIIGAGLNFVPYVGPLLSGVFGALTGDDEVKSRDTAARCANTRTFSLLTDFSFQCRYGVAQDAVDTNMLTQEGLFYVLNATLDRYINIMYKTYFSSPELMPEVTKEAARDFDKLEGYNQMIKDNNEKILSLKTVVSILGDIKDSIDSLNSEYKNDDGSFKEGKSEAEYENKIKAQINAFGRISASMVDGDDIAKASNLVDQIISEKNYIYKNLLKGPYGCEAFLQKPQPPFPPTGGLVKQPTNNWNNYSVNSIKRMPYPFPILYDYNLLSKGQVIPDPLNSGYKKDELPKMPADDYVKYDSYPPGFLSFVYFGTHYAGDNRDNYNGSERLSLGGLIYDYDTGGQGGEHVFDWVSLGKFEKTIKIY